MKTQKAIITLSVLLALSVCGNAFLGGLVMSRMRPPPALEAMSPGVGMPMGPEAARLRGGLRQFLHDIPADVRQPIIEAFRNDHDEMAARIKAIGSARADTISAMTTEPLDVDKLREALAAQRAVQSSTQEHVHEILVNVIEKLTPEQRQSLGQFAQKLFK